MSENLVEIPWKEALVPSYGRGVFSYDNRKVSRDTALQRAEELRQKLQLVYDEVTNHFDDLYVRITHGAKTGTIAKVHTEEIQINYATSGDTLIAGPANGEGVQILEATDYWSKTGAGRFYLDNMPQVPYCDEVELKVEGKGTVTKFYSDSQSLRSARPVLLIGYRGPTKWVFNRGKGLSDPKSITIKDRYNREVKKGDLVIIGRSTDGFLMVGKISRISDKRTVWIKHIGMSEEALITSVCDDQVLLIKDLEQTLMTEKLKTL